MAWIESHTALEKHPKVIRLRAAMRWSKNETIGFLHRFWWTVLDTSPSGDVSALSSPEVLSETLDLPVDVARRVFDTMLEVHLLERKGERILVHDWLDYAGTYLAGSLYKRKPDKMAEIRTVHGLSLDSPRTSQGQTGDRPGLVLDTRPTNQPTRPTEKSARAEAPPSPVNPEVTQADLDRALRVLDLYPDKAKKDGRVVRKDLPAQNCLAARIAQHPDYPWEDHAKLVRMTLTPLDAHNWTQTMPDVVALRALRKAAGRDPDEPKRKDNPAPEPELEPMNPADWEKFQADLKVLQAGGAL